MLNKTYTSSHIRVQDRFGTEVAYSPGSGALDLPLIVQMLFQI